MKTTFGQGLNADDLVAEEVAAERERCAVICEGIAKKYMLVMNEAPMYECAAAIRGQGRFKYTAGETDHSKKLGKEGRYIQHICQREVPKVPEETIKNLQKSKWTVDPETYVIPDVKVEKL